MGKNKKSKAKGSEVEVGVLPVESTAVTVVGQGRPSKFVAWTRALERVVDTIYDEDGNPRLNMEVIAMTDEGLVELVNRRTEDESQRIGLRTFVRYKSGDIAGLDPGELDRVELFMACYKRAVDAQRVALLNALHSDVPGGWQRYAWILERKFDDFNLRTKTVDETPDVRRLVLRVTEKT